MKAAVLALLAVWGAACSSTQTVAYRDTSRRMSDELLAQLEARVDTRGVRLSVSHFQTTGRALRTKVRHGRVYYDNTPRDDLPERLRDQLITHLAQRIRIVDAPPGAVEATAVLTGSVNFGEDEKVTVQTRILDARTREILATATAELAE